MSAHTPLDTPQVNEFSGLRALQFDDTTVQSVMSVLEPDLLTLDYTRAMMGFLLFNPSPRHILMIGLGGGSLARYCLSRVPSARFTAVEINPQVIALRECFALPPDDERFAVVCADGADYLRHCDERPDVVLVDGFVAAGLPDQLGSAAFYADCRAALSDDGLLVVNHWKGDRRYPLHASRLREAFSGRVLTIGAEDGDNRVSFAGGAHIFPPRRAQLLARVGTLEKTHVFGVTDIAQRIRKRMDGAQREPD